MQPTVLETATLPLSYSPKATVFGEFMKKQFKLGVIGCGFWAQTILKGIVLSDFLRGKKILVCDTSEEKLEEVRSLGVRM